MVMALTVDSWTLSAPVVLVSGLDLAVLLLVVALYDPQRFNWAARGVTGIVFLAFVAYLIDELLSGKSWRFGTRRETLEALLGLLIVGLPCLRYSLVGRFR
jgi:hypothetical protein